MPLLFGNTASAGGDPYIDSNITYLQVAAPLNLEWGFHDARSWIKQYGAGSAIDVSSYVSAGNPTISASQYKYYAQSAYFDGTGDLVTYRGFDGDFGTGDFTVEGWFRPSSFTAETLFRRLFAFGDSLANDFGLNVNTSGNVLYRNNDTVLITSNSTLSTNTWYHISLERYSGTTTLYIDGTAVGTTSTNNNLSSAGSFGVTLGNHPNGNGTFNGYIQDFKVYKGVAVHKGNFGAPANGIVTYTGDTSYKNYITLAVPFNSSNNFSDISATLRGWGNNRTTTALGSATVSTAQSKFYGYSLDATGTSVAKGVTVSNKSFIPSNGDFTIEFWVRQAAVNPVRNQYFFAPAGTISNTDSGLLIETERANLPFEWYSSGAQEWELGNGSYFSGAWYHIALVRSSGTMSVFKNGVKYANTYSVATNYNEFNTTSWTIGGIPSANALYNGNSYINDFRIYSGYAKYTSNFTPYSTGFAA